VDLPEFAAYPLLRTDDGRALLRSYFGGYAAIAERAGAGLRLEAPTWRANPDWGALLGDDATALDAANQMAIAAYPPKYDRSSARPSSVRRSGYAANSGRSTP
jgi:homocysteine S-methyltransferase